MTEQTQTIADERKLHILKEAENSPADSHRDIAERLNEKKSDTVNSYSESEVQDVIRNHDLPERFTGAADVPPATDFGKITTVISDSETLKEKVINGDYTSEEIAAVITQRWGEEFALDEDEIPFGVRYWRRNNLGYPEFYDELEVTEDIARRLSTNGFDTKESLLEATEEDLTEVPYIGSGRAEGILEAVEEMDPEGGESVELPSPVQTEVSEPVNTGTERAKKTILDDEELLRETYENPSEVVQTVRERTEEEFGVGFQPTEGSVHKAISDIWGDSVDLDHDPSQTILYRCSLCGLEDTDARAVKRHISNSGDMAHEDRNGSTESHLVVVSGDTEMEVPGDRPDGVTDTGFDVLWSVYNNPDARQRDIAEIVGLTQSEVSRKLRNLGVDWENREEQVSQLFDDWMNNGGSDEEEEEEEEEMFPELESGGEKVVRETGQAKYEGPATGLDVSPDRPVTYLSEVDTSTENEAGGGLGLNAEEAFLLLTGGADTPAHRKVFKAALSGEWNTEDFA